MKHARVVIVGGGFAGLFAARALGRSGHAVTLLDRCNFHTFQPLLYQVAIGALTTGDVATPHRIVLRDAPDVSVLMSEALAVDVAERRLRHRHGELEYDVLVAATGVRHSYFGQDAWARHAPGLKTVEHALEMRRRIFRSLELAELEPDDRRRRALMTFVVVGAGPTGVELAGALGELTMRNMAGDFRRIDPTRCRILLVEGGPEVLPVYTPRLRRAAKASLEKLGVTVLTGARVEQIGAGTLRFRRGDLAETVEAGTILWAAGVQVSEFGAELARASGAATDRAGRLVVGPDLSLPGHPEIFVAGDLAAIRQPDGSAVPGLAPAAIQAGEHVARVLQNRAAGQPTAAFRYRDRGSMAVIGRNHAVGDLKFLHVSGVFAWLLWALVHVWSLIHPEKRLRVFVQWGWKYFASGTGDRLVTGERGAAPPEPENLHETGLA